MVPVEDFETPTPALSTRCSAPELHEHGGHQGNPTPHTDFARVRRLLGTCAPISPPPRYRPVFSGLKARCITLMLEGEKLAAVKGFEPLTPD